VQVADIGDICMNIYNLPEAIKQIKVAYDNIVSNGCIPLTMGGDHTITYPILQAIKVCLP
jgi:arginase family enzyme